MDTIHTIMPSHLPLILLSMLLIMNVRQMTLAALRGERRRRSRMPQQRLFLDDHALYPFYLVKRKLPHVALETFSPKTSSPMHLVPESQSVIHLTCQNTPVNHWTFCKSRYHFNETEEVVVLTSVRVWFCHTKQQSSRLQKREFTMESMYCCIFVKLFIAELRIRHLFRVSQKWGR
jgi:hypothetical protein